MEKVEPTGKAQVIREAFNYGLSNNQYYQCLYNVDKYINNSEFMTQWSLFSITKLYILVLHV